MASSLIVNVRLIAVRREREKVRTEKLLSSPRVELLTAENAIKRSEDAFDDSLARERNYRFRSIEKVKSEILIRIESVASLQPIEARSLLLSRSDISARALLGKKKPSASSDQITRGA